MNNFFTMVYYFEEIIKIIDFNINKITAVVLNSNEILFNQHFLDYCWSNIEFTIEGFCRHASQHHVAMCFVFKSDFFHT